MARFESPVLVSCSQWSPGWAGGRSLCLLLHGSMSRTVTCQEIIFYAHPFPNRSLASSNTYIFFRVHIAFCWGTTFSHPLVLQRQLFSLSYHYISFSVLVWIRSGLWKWNSHPLHCALVHTANVQTESLLHKIELEDVLQKGITFTSTANGSSVSGTRLELVWSNSPPWNACSRSAGSLAPTVSLLQRSFLPRFAFTEWSLTEFMSSRGTHTPCNRSWKPPHRFLPSDTGCVDWIYRDTLCKNVLKNKTQTLSQKLKDTVMFCIKRGLDPCPTP